MHICLFDIDGTLISSGGAGMAALQAALQAEFGLAGLIEKLQLSGRTDRAILFDLLRMHVIEDNADNWRRLIDAYLRHLPSCLATGAGRILPGISQLLQQLSEREDVCVGLLTGNLRRGAEVKLRHFGLFDYFDFGGYGDHHLDRDDVAREALSVVRERWQESVAPERIWVVGDTPLDIRCARAIGVGAVAVATGWHSMEELQGHRPDLLMEDLEDAGEFLDKLRAVDIRP